MDAPPYFYKYRSLAGKGRDSVRSTLLENSIFLANPASFNDPFDCLPAYAPTLSEQGAYDLAIRYLSRQHPRWSEEKIQNEAKTFVRQTRRADMALIAQALRENNEEMRHWLALYCVSGTCSNALMWAHYADSHRGICIGFASDVDILREAQQVKYSKARHPVDPIHDSNESRLVNSLLLKSEDWSYEQEWRYIGHQYGPGEYQIQGDAVREVILGARISPQDELHVLSWVERMDKKPALLRASINLNHFKLDIHPYEQT